MKASLNTTMLTQRQCATVLKALGDETRLRILESLLTGELTSREFLYHLPCEQSARTLDRFGSGRPTHEATMWTEDHVVVSSPPFRHDLRFVERVEQLAVQKLLPHLAMI